MGLKKITTGSKPAKKNSKAKPVREKLWIRTCQANEVLGTSIGQNNQEVLKYGGWGKVGPKKHPQLFQERRGKYQAEELYVEVRSLRDIRQEENEEAVKGAKRKERIKTQEGKERKGNSPRKGDHGRAKLLSGHLIELSRRKERKRKNERTQCKKGRLKKKKTMTKEGGGPELYQ